MQFLPFCDTKQAKYCLVIIEFTGDFDYSVDENRAYKSAIYKGMSELGQHGPLLCCLMI